MRKKTQQELSAMTREERRAYLQAYMKWQGITVTSTDLHEAFKDLTQQLSKFKRKAEFIRYIGLFHPDSEYMDDMICYGLDGVLNKKQIEWLEEYKNNIKQRAEPQHKELPEGLNTDRAKELLQKAIDAGLCTDTYTWNKTKALLAYFADRASEYLNLGKGEYDGKPKISWKPFETLFGIKGLAITKKDNLKIGTLPRGYEDLDKLF